MRSNGGISPSKRAHAELSPRHLEGDNLVSQFHEAFTETSQILDADTAHAAVLENLNKKIKVQEVINSPKNVAKHYQDMVEVQNWMGSRNPKEASAIIAAQLVAVTATTRHLTDVMLDNEKCNFVTNLYQTHGKKLANFGKEIITSAITQLTPYLIPCTRLCQVFTSTGPRSTPGDLLTSRLLNLEMP